MVRLDTDFWKVDFITGVASLMGIENPSTFPSCPEVARPSRRRRMNGWSHAAQSHAACPATLELSPSSADLTSRLRLSEVSEQVPELFRHNAGALLFKEDLPFPNGGAVFAGCRIDR